MDAIEATARAAEAQHILDNALVVEAFEVIEKEISYAFLQLHPDQTPLAENLMNFNHAFKRFKGVFEKAIKKGKLANADIVRQPGEKPRLVR